MATSQSTALILTPKIQIPMNSHTQIPTNRPPDWELGIGISLGFGSWDFLLYGGGWPTQLNQDDARQGDGGPDQQVRGQDVHVEHHRDRNPDRRLEIDERRHLARRQVRQREEMEDVRHD